jgi:isoquinoline 1-oxidoreductase subunit beta
MTEQMTERTKPELLETEISRRGFVAGSAGLTFAFTFGAGIVGQAAGALAGADSKLSAWVSIGADGMITIMQPGAEMGQGVHTTLPMIVAEELDADWSMVTPEFAPPNPKVYGNPHPALKGGRLTVGSFTIGGYFNLLRMAGAQARRVLLDNVAAKWKVPVGELTTEPSMVVHIKSNRSISYGDVAKFATVPAEAPKIAMSDLKKKSEYRLIGKDDLPRVDIPSKVDGSARYAMDVMVPGMIYATVKQTPMEGAKAAKFNGAEVMKIKGVIKAFPLPFGVAVIGTSYEAVKAGRDALEVTWDTSKARGANFNSASAQAEYDAHGRESNAQGKAWFKKGDAGKAMAGASKTLEGVYTTEYTYHAQMEPMNCVAKVSADGKSADVWIGSQFTALIGLVGAKVLKTKPQNIRVHQYLLGGGYGRRIWPDAAVQAMVLSKITKKPVKLILTREDDIAAARPRPFTHHIVKAGMDNKGDVTAWHHRLISENVDAVAAPPRFKATGGLDIIGMRGLEQPYYGIPNMLGEAVREQRGMRVHAWRGIGSGYNKFASESFIDEIALAKGIDPLDYRLELTKDKPRANAIIKAVADMADWKRKRANGRGLGIAFSDYHGTVTAGVAEVSVDKTSGKITVHDFWIAADPGLIVHPDSSHAQLESGVVYGISAVLKEKLTIANGSVQESNFHDYEVLRMEDVPEIHTKMVETDNPPTGMGEVGIPSAAAAIGNAVFAATGTRLRHLPMSPDNVKAAMKG